MKIAELNHLENVNESSLVNGGLSIIYPPYYGYGNIDVSASGHGWADGILPQVWIESHVSVGQYYGSASNYVSASSMYGSASASSHVSGSSN
ncbi:hypothetical protein ACP6PL_14545 [Dapis sp. BLCC M126]|uniref:hypothetical protein n=1 Tax=Dapis sp. BLCC M126 TaxID=3400189 RepID=UPI003CF6B4F9